MPVPAVVVFGSPNKVAGRARPGGHSAAAEHLIARLYLLCERSDDARQAGWYGGRKGRCVVGRAPGDSDDGTVVDTASFEDDTQRGAVFAPAHRIIEAW